MSRWDLLDWIRLIVAVILGLIFLLVCLPKINRPTANAGINPPATTTTTDTTSTITSPTGLAITEPTGDATLEAGGFILRGTGTAGEELEIFEGSTALGKVMVGADGTWSKEIPSSSVGGPQTYKAVGPSGETSVGVTLTAVSAGTGTCDKEFSLSVNDGETLAQPFRFGGDGKGGGYTVTVKRGERTIGTKVIPLDSSCGWSYPSSPGLGPITYEVRETDAGADSTPVATVNLTIQ